MADPARQLILANIDTVLQTITVANGYKSTVVTVSRAIKGWSEVGVSLMPFIGFAPIGRSSATYKPNGYLDVIMPVTIIGHTNSLSGATKTEDLSALQDDIIAALNVDTTRGNNAIRSNWSGTQTDEGNPDSDDHRGGSGTLVMDWTILYQRKVTST